MEIWRDREYVLWCGICDWQAMTYGDDVTRYQEDGCPECGSHDFGMREREDGEELESEMVTTPTRWQSTEDRLHFAEVEGARLMLRFGEDGMWGRQCVALSEEETDDFVLWWLERRGYGQMRPHLFTNVETLTRTTGHETVDRRILGQ
jgi:hypothetical protein